jgi:short-subunit dehydrogenase
MRQRKTGKIINISSMGGKMYTPLGAWYHATKQALEGWSDCLRLELKQFNIDIVIVEPGIIETEFTSVMKAPFMERSGKRCLRRYGPKGCQSHCR